VAGFGPPAPVGDYDLKNKKIRERRVKKSKEEQRLDWWLGLGAEP
jgi:hypothetical protein